MKRLRYLLRKRYREQAIAFFLIYVLCLDLLVSITWAGPEGAQVINGKVSIQQSAHNTTITASDKAIINYNSFDIPQSETVRFIQPGSTASVLNRILSANPTNIDGTLLANGRVFFVNPAGIYIGAGARINVNQLVASGLNISDSDFINERYNFAEGNGSIINNGDISAEEVYLVGKRVTNSGSISCPAGYVVMAAGDRVFLGESGTEIVLEIDEFSSSEPADAAGAGAGVLNEGNIESAGGIIALAAAGDIYSQAISNVGTISASVETGNAGDISLSAPDGTVTNTGTIEASGSEGGQVAMEGTRVGQFGTLHADGTSGDGGTVNLWADEVVALSQSSLTTANAGTHGDGGEVIVYSPDSTLLWADALIEVKGGSESGDGGFVEVSGIEYVKVDGFVDRRAPHGDAGLLYIDPTDLTIDDAGTDDTLWTGHAWADNVGRDTSQIDIDTLETHIALGDTSIDTTTGGGGGSGNITVNAGRDIVDSSSGNSLSLTGDDITFTSGVDFSGTGNLDVLASGAVDIDSGITLASGDFTSTGTTFDNTGGVISTAGGAVDIRNTGNVTIGANINAAGGAISIDGGDDAGGGTATSIIDGGGTITSSNTISLEASGNIGTSGARIDIAGTGTIDARSTVAGDIFIDNTGAVTLGTVSTTSSDIVIDNTGDLSINSIAAGGGGNVTIDATGAIEDDGTNDGTAEIIAATIDLNASTGIGAGGSFDITGTSISADTTNGAIDLDSLATTSVTATSLTTGTGIIRLDQTGGQTLDVDLATTTDGAITITNDNAALTVTNVTAGSGVTIQADDITLMGSLTAGSGYDIQATNNVVFGATGKVTGSAPSTISAGGSIANTGSDETTTIETTGAGSNLTLTAANASTPSTNPMTILSSGDLTVNAPLNNTSSTTTLSSADDLVINRDITDATALSAHAGTDGSGDVTFGAGVTLNAPTVTLQAGDGVDGADTTAVVDLLNNTPTVLADSLTIEQDGQMGSAAAPWNPNVANNATIDLNPISRDSSIYTTEADSWQAITATAQGDVALLGDGTITTNAVTSTVGNIEIGSTGGDMEINGSLTATGGGVSLISETGEIYTDGSNGLDVPITGFSNQALNIGVGLPVDDGQKAAIVIRSPEEDLILGAGATLTANGLYSSVANDDRLAVDFSILPGEQGGDPIDVAIYLSSYEDPLPQNPALYHDVSVDSQVFMADNGTMVIDADDTVTLDTFSSPASNQTHRLELVSRRSDNMPEVIQYGRLPFARNPALISTRFRGKYVLRGDTILALVLELTDPVPWAAPRPLEPETGDEVEGPDMDAIMQFLEKLGLEADMPLLARAYKETLSTDLRLYKAVEKLMRLEGILNDSSRITVLIPLIQGITETPKTIEEQMASFDQELSRQDSAGQWVNALTEFVAILNIEIGQELEMSMRNAMRLYGNQLGGEENELFVEEFLAQKFLE